MKTLIKLPGHRTPPEKSGNAWRSPGPAAFKDRSRRVIAEGFGLLRAPQLFAERVGPSPPARTPNARAKSPAVSTLLLTILTAIPSPAGEPVQMLMRPAVPGLERFWPATTAPAAALSVTTSFDEPAGLFPSLTVEPAPTAPLASCGTGVFAQPAAAPPCAFAEGELLVKLRPGTGMAAPSPHARMGATVIRSFEAIGWQHVRLPRGMTVSEGLARYRQLPEVACVERNSACELCGVPNDTLYPTQWNLAKIGAPAAWDITTGSSDVVIAVLDSGIKYNHPDLSANMWRNPGETGLDASSHDKATNGVDDDNNGYVDDVFGIDAFDHDSDPMDLGQVEVTGKLFHGTAVAGILGAVGNNGQGLAGVAWSVQLMALRRNGGDPINSTARLFLDRALEGYEYAIQMKRRGVNVRAINNSWGFLDYNQAQFDAFEAAGREGILSICSAGNSPYNNDVYSRWPACYDLPYVISVAATDSSDLLADFSNFGRSTVDLAAPGAGISTTYRTDTADTFVTGFSGTSYAAPHVSGTVALLASAHPGTTWQEMKAALLQSVDQPTSLANRVVSHGRLNVARALQIITSTSLPPVVIGSFPASSRTRSNASIELWFNQPMDQSSVEAALVVTPPVTGTFEWSDNDRVCRLVPGAPFSAVTHTARLQGSARALSGATLAGNFNRVAQASPADDYVWTFSFAPANDNFAESEVISGASGTLTTTTRNASHEVDEQYHAGSFYSVASVWYRWTPGTDGWTTFSTSLNSFDTLLAGYTGERIEALTVAASNDNTGSLTGSRLSFPVTAGTTYFIAVAGKAANTLRAGINDTSMGSFKLNWLPTPAPVFTGTQFSPSSARPGATVTLTGTDFTGTTAVLFNGASAVFTHVAGSYWDLRITATLPPDATSGPITIVTPHGSVTSSNSFTVLPPVSFAAWASGYGLTGANAAPDADPDLDGMSNSVEDVLSGNPKVPSTAGLPICPTIGGNVVFTFSRADVSETPDVTLAVQAGPDLMNWPTVYTIGPDTAASSPGVMIAENGAAPDNITVTIPQGTATIKFVRLTVTVTP